MPRGGGGGAMAGEYGNIFLLAVSNARDGKNLVCQRHNAVSGRVAASDTPEILAAVERVRREKSTEDEMQFEGRGVPSGLKVYVACDSSFTYSVVVDRAYPDRHGYKLLREFAREMAGDYGGVLRSTKKAGGATGKVERVTTSLLQKYDDLANIDKVAALQSEVDRVKSRMNDNIQAQFANMESADDLEESTALMRDTGADPTAHVAPTRAWSFQETIRAARLRTFLFSCRSTLRQLLHTVVFAVVMRLL